MAGAEQQSGKHHRKPVHILARDGLAHPRNQPHDHCHEEQAQLDFLGDTAVERGKETVECRCGRRDRRMVMQRSGQVGIGEHGQADDRQGGSDACDNGAKPWKGWPGLFRQP